jgi:undecaprenyl-diphosphatase
VGGGALLTWLLKHWIARPRPDLVPHLVEVSTLSFPSGHAMQSAVVFLTLGALLARTNSQRAVRFYVMMITILLTVLVGVSRVFLGVHWPTDVLGGWCAGALWSAACSLFAASLKSRR